MKRKLSSRIMSLVLAAAMFCSLAGTVSADTWAYKDHSAVTSNQPLMLGQRKCRCRQRLIHMQQLR